MSEIWPIRNPRPWLADDLPHTGSVSRSRSRDCIQLCRRLHCGDRRPPVRASRHATNCREEEVLPQLCLPRMASCRQGATKLHSAASGRSQTVAQASCHSRPGFCEENPGQNRRLARRLGGTGVSPVGMQARRPYYPYAGVLTGETPVPPLRWGSYGRDARTTQAGVLTGETPVPPRRRRPADSVRDSPQRIPDRIGETPAPHFSSLDARTSADNS